MNYKRWKNFYAGVKHLINNGTDISIILDWVHGYGVNVHTIK